MPTPLTTKSGLRIGIAARHRSPTEFSADELRVQDMLIGRRSHVIAFRGAMNPRLPQPIRTKRSLARRFIDWIKGGTP